MAFFDPEGGVLPARASFASPGNSLRTLARPYKGRSNVNDPYRVGPDGCATSSQGSQSLALGWQNAPFRVEECLQSLSSLTIEPNIPAHFAFARSTKMQDGKACETRIRLAHFSDIHLTARPLGWGLRDFLSKRLTGWMHLRLGRGRRFRDAETIVHALMDDIRECGCQHIVFSGDATTMGFESEFAAAARAIRFDLPGIAVPEIMTTTSAPPPIQVTSSDFSRPGNTASASTPRFIRLLNESVIAG